MSSEYKYYKIKIAIIDTLASVMKKYGKQYCYPSQERILELLSEFHGIEISRRTLNRVLDEMTSDKMIHRIRRHKKAANGRIEFATTAYYILQRVVADVKRFLRSAVRVANIFRVPDVAQYSLTTKRDLKESCGILDEQVPIEWIREFRASLCT